MTTETAEQMWQRANATWQAGNAAKAQEILLAGTATFANDSAMHNSAGSLFQKMGFFENARACFAQALTLNPRALDFAINYAISLSALNRHHDSVAVLKRFEKAGAGSALYASTRAAAERGLGNRAASAKWYDCAIALEPARPKALHGRAQIALERGEDDAVARFDQALSANQGDAALWLGKAQALDAAGDHAAARTITEALVQTVPQWGDSLRFLAQLRLAAGDRDFTSHYRDAAHRAPQYPNIYTDWSEVLAGLDFNAEAAEVAARGSAAFPEMDIFRVLEANYAGASGDNDRAETLYNALEQHAAHSWLHEARHRIRQSQYEQAERLLTKVLTDDPGSISAWALLGLVWRLTDNSKADWLHAHAEFVQLLPLIGDAEILSDVVPVLHHLHDTSPLPLGQSLRGGSQTRGHLFDRTEEEITALEHAIRATVDIFQQSLPPSDAQHPLLSHRDSPWTLAGSWSVRLTGRGDYHTSHIHPQGIVSSALYLTLPGHDPVDEMAGWLEIGRPPPDLQVALPPLRLIEPQIGHLALFPSTLYHGTRPFSGPQRMTVAFDVICDTTQ